MNLKENELPTKIADILYKANLLTGKSLLEIQECDLRNAGYISQDDIQTIFSITANKAKTAEFFSGEQLQGTDNRRWASVTTGCIQIDNLLRGGVLTRGITEISGQSSCGKTQLCLQLAITVQLPTVAGGLSQGAAFISTEDKFPAKRLHQMTKTCAAAKKFPNIKFQDNIFIEHFHETADLLKCVEERLPQLVERHKIGLIVVDSVAAIFRADYSYAETRQRAIDLRNLAYRLHLLANTYNIAVVCVNQVSDVKKGDISETVPALGLAWANLITCRLQMFRTNNVRELQVTFAPHLPKSSCRYKITEAGVEDFD